MPSARVTQWRSLAERIGAGYQVSPALILAIITVESGGDPRAWRDEPDTVAGVNEGSHGLMQLLLSTARGLGYTGNGGTPSAGDGLFAPETNVTFGAKLLRDLLRTFGGSVPRVASAYNGGNRPSLGFGTKLARDVRLCLAKNPAGECVQWHDARAGEFGNQAYVDKVLAAYVEWTNLLTPIAPLPAAPYAPDVIDLAPLPAPGAVPRQALPAAEAVAGLVVVGAVVLGALIFKRG